MMEYAYLKHTPRDRLVLVLIVEKLKAGMLRVRPLDNPQQTNVVKSSDLWVITRF